MSAQTLLVVEGDPGLQHLLRRYRETCKVLVAGDRASAVIAVRRHPPAVALLDLQRLSDAGSPSEGLATLGEILSIAPYTKVIALTGHDDPSGPVHCIGHGAHDVYRKPVDPAQLAFAVERAFRLYALEEEHRRLRRAAIANPLEGIVASSPEMHEVCRLIERLAPTDMTVLLLGESGTGKEILARALHNLSPRAKKPFIAINAAAIPENLLESELFGFEKGAYTGALQQTKGKFELADGGTFFLDEIGDIPPCLQPKLLRVLQERAIERIGGRQPIHVDVRVICATHRNLSRLIGEGRFREDLYFRINEMIVTIPPLRERVGDVAVLARAFLDRFTQQMRRPRLLGFTDGALAAMEAYPWPGNVRELEHKIKRAVVMAAGPLIGAGDLELTAGETRRRLMSLREARETAERQAIGLALGEAGENITKAAEILDVARPTLYALLTKFNLKV